MVWQIVSKSEGRYRPDFDFVDGDIRSVRVAHLDSDQPEPFQTGTYAFSFGAPISPDHVPTVIKWNSSEPVYDYLSPYGASCVSARFRQLIEGLEPDVHQFLPLRIVDAQNEHIADHSIWIPCNRIDSVDREHTTWILMRERLWMTPNHFADEELPPGYDRSQPVKMVFNAAQAGKCHFWRDKHVGPGRLYCSDSAADAIVTGKYTGARLGRKDTV